MLTVPYSRRLAVLEPNHVVLPVSNMITKFVEEYGIAEIIGIEVHIESVNEAGAMVVYDYRTALCAIRPSVRVGDYTVEPFWSFRDIHG